MKAQEIVRALRCCAKGLGHDDKCENCRVGEIQDRREYIEFAAANVIERLTAENAALREYAAMMHECEMCKNDSYCPVGAPTGGDCGNHSECDGCPCRDCEETDHWALRELPGTPAEGEA